MLTVQSTDEPDGVPDVEEEPEPDRTEDGVIEETMFTFESFELVREALEALCRSGRC